MLHTFDRHHVGSKYHVEAPTPKHAENSTQGVHHAFTHHYRTIDLDILPDRTLHEAVKRAIETSTFVPPAAIAYHIPNDHWPQPMEMDGFRDPRGALHPHTPIDEMADFEWERLVAGRWPNKYHIPHIEDQFSLCHRLNVQALIEPKHSIVWLRHEVWAYLAQAAEQRGCHTAVYSLMHECLPFAREVGFKAWPV